MRERIQNAAIELFYDQSYQLTTIRDISDACGITPGAIYNHFSSKDELLYTVIRQAHDHFDREVTAVKSQGYRSATEELYHLVVAFVRYHALHRHASLVANHYYRFLSEKYGPEILDQRRRLRGAFEQVLASGSKAGEFDLPLVAGKPSPRVASIAIGDMALRVAEWYQPGAALTPDEVAEAYAQLALNMIKAKRKASSRR